MKKFLDLIITVVIVKVAFKVTATLIDAAWEATATQIEKQKTKIA